MVRCAGIRIVMLNETACVLGGDVVTGLNGEPISSAGRIARVLLYEQPGQDLNVTLYREGRLLEVAVPLGPMHGR